MQNETQIELRKPKENQAGTLEEEPNHFQFGRQKQIGPPVKTQIARTQIVKTTRFNSKKEEQPELKEPHFWFWFV